MSTIILEILKNKLGGRGGSTPIKARVNLTSARLDPDPLTVDIDIVGVIQDEDGVMYVITDEEDIHGSTQNI